MNNSTSFYILDSYTKHKWFGAIMSVLPTLTTEAGLVDFLEGLLGLSESAAAQLIQCLIDAGAHFALSG
jgi:hypothetical protein